MGAPVEPPLPSVSSELAPGHEPIKQIVSPTPRYDSYPTDEVSLAPSSASAETTPDTSELAIKVTPPLPTSPVTRWPVEKEAFVEQARRVPLIKTVGQEAKLVCGVKSPGSENEVKWDKIGGNMPFKFRIERGDLVIEDLRKEDEGLYQCSLTIPGAPESVFFIDLKVAGKNALFV